MNIRPADCRCDGYHTDAIEAAVPDASIDTLISMEDCPAEKRALQRVLARRKAGLS